MSPKPLKTRRTWLWHASFVLGCAVLAIFLRAYFVHDQVFTNGGVNFQEADPWYHVRAIEHLTHNFPHRLVHDPYALHPGGQHVPVGPLFDVLVASVAIVLAMGRAGPELTHAVSAWAPAVMGSLIPIIAYLLGRRLKGKTCGLTAAFLIAILPGAFLHRSLLGFTDHHVAECLFSVLAIWLLIEACERGKGGRATAQEFKVNGRNQRFSLAWAAAAGLALGCYLLSWVGGALLAAVVCMAFLTYTFSEHFRCRQADRAAVTGAVCMAVAGLFVAPYLSVHPYRFHFAATTGAAAFLLLLGALARLIRQRSWSRGWLLPGAVAIAAIAAIALSVIFPRVLDQAAGELWRFARGFGGAFVVEAMPIFFNETGFTLRPGYKMFATGLFTGGVGLLMVCWLALRHGRAAFVFVAVWSLALLAITLRQQRFGYYLALPVAVLSGYFWAAAYDQVRRFSGRFRIPSIVQTFGSLAVFVIVAAYPCWSSARFVAKTYSGPNQDWREAMAWLRHNSPEPFGSADAYYATYPKEIVGQVGPVFQSHGIEGQAADNTTADIQSTARSSDDFDPYGVLCWWDHGYWITTMAHRIPTANPTQAGAIETAQFLIAQNEEAGIAAMHKLGARYVVLDASLPVWTSESSNELIGKFGAIVRWMGGSELDYYEPYLLPVENNQFQVVILYYPAFYQSMLSRLYLFGAREIIPRDSTWLVRYTEVPHKRGGHVKRIDDTLPFPTYEAAKQFQASNSGNWRIVSATFEESCVPLEKLTRFKPIYSSPTVVAHAANRPIAHVEIFEFDE